MSSCPLLHIQVHIHFVILSPIFKTNRCRTNKSEGTTLFLADVLSACYGDTNTIIYQPPHHPHQVLIQLKFLRYGRH